MIYWLQEFLKNWAVAVEAVATLLLVIAAGFQWWTMRAQAQQERDRWKREDNFRRLVWLDNCFNSTAMLVARRRLGIYMLERYRIVDMQNHISIQSALTVVSFFTKIMQLYEQGRVDLGDATIAYSDYINLILFEFNGPLQSGAPDQLRLLKAFKSSIKDSGFSGDESSRRRFWEIEADL